MVIPKELQPLLYTSDQEQMVTILDALESVTNGMEYSGLLEQIKDIPMRSPLRPYVDLIFALHAYYRNDPSEVRQFLDSLPDDSPPARLKPLISFLTGLTEDPPKGKAQKEILKAIQKRKSNLETAIEETELYLQKNHEESFSDSVAYLIRELYGKFPDLSKQLTLWALKKIQENRWAGNLLHAHLKMILGELETSRLKALYLLHLGCREAFQAWSSFLMKLLLSEPRNEQTVEATLLIWIYTGMQEQENSERVKNILDVLEKKHPSVKEKYGKLLKELSSSRSGLSLKGGSSIPLPHSARQTAEPLPHKKDSFGQLELFPS